MYNLSKEEIDEMFKNRREMKRIARFSNIAFWIGVLPGIAFTALSAFYMILSMFSFESNTLALAINLLLCGAYSWLFFSGLGERKVIPTVAAPVMILISGSLCGLLGGQTEQSLGGMEMIYFAPSFLIALASLYTYRRYNYLSQQPGFPYFDESLKANEEASREARFHTEYEDNYKEWKKNERAEMEHATACGVIEERRHEAKTDLMRISDTTAAANDLTRKSSEKPRDYFAEMREKEMKEKKRLAMLGEMAEHAEMLRKTKKLYRLPVIAYVLLCVPCILAVPFLPPLYSGDALAHAVADGLVFKVGALICAFFGVKKRNDVLAASAAALLLMNAIVVRSPAVFWLFSVTKLPINIVYFIIAAAACAVNITADCKYRYLEKQYGYPYFNKRMLNDEPQEIKRVSGEKQAEQRREMPKPALNDMGMPVAPPASKKENGGNNGYMDVI